MNDRASASKHHDLNRMVLARLLASLISITLVGLGLLAIFTEHYDGSSSKLGRAEVSLWGMPAVLMGVSTACLGMTPLALWFSSKKSALRWALLSVGSAGVAFALAYTLLRA